jgi:Zn finger protein HypA/HybF involved in hydrogenase expression
MNDTMLDGNALAGLLQEVFAVEVTTAIGTCAHCGTAGPVGAVHVYRGAGTVLRCPHCDNTLAKIVRSDSRVWIDFTGIRTLEATSNGSSSDGHSDPSLGSSR